ncbi:MAG: acyl-CoA dehydrogenase family protein [Promethearchaeota archaeon]
MYDFCLNENAIKFKNYAREFVKNEVSRQLIIDMDEDKIEYPRYAHKRKAVGKLIKSFQGVSFKLADSIMLLDASRSLVYQTAKAIDSGQPAPLCRRLVSEAKRFCTESATTIINHCMQILGGIGYTNVFPIERFLRDIRLSTIWTGTSEIMNLIIQHEFFKEVLKNNESVRDIEKDAKECDALDEKIYE